MHVVALSLQLHLRTARSLKDKRSAIRPIVEGARRRFAVAAAEVSDNDAWKVATIGLAAVSGSASHANQVMDAAERFVWSFPEVEVTSVRRIWTTDEES